MVDITEFLAKLGAQRSIFHSEADFQHAFAWELHQWLPSASIRLEFPVLRSEKQLHLDIWVAQANATLAFELKYKTRALSVQVDGEQFYLKDHAAQPPNRYDFIKDIQRLEQVVFAQKNMTGYAILLTNDSAYWQLPRDRCTIDADFRLHEGRNLHGVLSWSAGAALGTIRSREEPIELKGSYNVHWERYSEPSSQGHGKFRYLAVKVVAHNVPPPKL